MIFTGAIRGFLLPGLLLMAGLLQPGYLKAQTSEERLSALEARLSRLERNLELLLRKASSGSPLDAQALKELKDTAQPLAGDLQQVQAASVPQVEPMAAPIPQSMLVGTSSPTPTGEAAAEIQNVPYAGYMETHLNHDSANPTTFDFHRFV